MIAAGQTYGRWTVLGPRERRGPNGYIEYWKCKCQCGAVRFVYKFSLLHGKSQSCGCLTKDIMHYYTATHGESKTGLYRTYMKMLGRCRTPTDNSYKIYGRRGISVCTRWLGKNGFLNFRHDVGERPSPKHSLDRVNNNRGYSPKNCRWATSKEQARNKQDTFYVEYGKRKVCLAALCEELEIPYMRTYLRLRRYGYSVEDAVRM